MHFSRMRTARSLTISRSICWGGGCMPCMPPAMYTPCHRPPAIHAPLPCMPSALHASLLHMLPAMYALHHACPPCHACPHHTSPCCTCPLPCTPPAMHVTHQAHSMPCTHPLPCMSTTTHTPL